MAEMLIVPGQCLDDLRSGLVGVWGAAAEDIGRLTVEYGVSAGRQVYDGPRWTYAAAWAYLDTCWRQRHVNGEVVLDLAQGPQIILDALSGQRLSLVDQLAESHQTMPRAGSDAIEARIVALERFAQRVGEHV